MPCFESVLQKLPRGFQSWYFFFRLPIPFSFDHKNKAIGSILKVYISHHERRVPFLRLLEADSSEATGGTSRKEPHSAVPRSQKAVST